MGYTSMWLPNTASEEEGHAALDPSAFAFRFPIRLEWFDFRLVGFGRRLVYPFAIWLERTPLV